MDATNTQLRQEAGKSEMPCMGAKPQQEHAWLSKIVGEWTYEHECVMGPGQPVVRTSGSESVRSLGGLWIVGEGRGEMPDGSPATTLITLGYDPQKQRFVGTFVGSMMTHLWLYDGALDAAANVLTLDAEGPSFSGDGSMAAYQDIVEIRSDDHRVLRSRVRDTDGTWREFMTGHYRRKH
jgi:Protein of unknown function (DUF1579)